MLSKKKKGRDRKRERKSLVLIFPQAFSNGSDMDNTVVFVVWEHWSARASSLLLDERAVRQHTGRWKIWKKQRVVRGNRVLAS